MFLQSSMSRSDLADAKIARFLIGVSIVASSNLGLVVLLCPLPPKRMVFIICTSSIPRKMDIILFILTVSVLFLSEHVSQSFSGILWIIRLFFLLSLSVYLSHNCIVDLSAFVLVVNGCTRFSYSLCSVLCIHLTVWAHERTTSSFVSIISFILHYNVVINFSRSFPLVYVLGREESLSSPCLEAQNVADNWFTCYTIPMKTLPFPYHGMNINSLIWHNPIFHIE